MFKLSKSYSCTAGPSNVQTTIFSVLVRIFTTYIYINGLYNIADVCVVLKYIYNIRISAPASVSCRCF